MLSSWQQVISSTKAQPTSVLPYGAFLPKAAHAVWGRNIRRRFILQLKYSVRTYYTRFDEVQTSAKYATIIHTTKNQPAVPARPVFPTSKLACQPKRRRPAKIRELLITVKVFGNDLACAGPQVFTELMGELCTEKYYDIASRNMNLELLQWCLRPVDGGGRRSPELSSV